MTEEDLKKLRRSDLLELLIAQERENEQLRAQVTQLKERMEEFCAAHEELRPGDEVRFTDTEGNAFRYTVAELETLGKYDVEEMAAGDWDLTLFTCTYGGQSRVTVRCLRVTEEP